MTHPTRKHAWKLLASAAGSACALAFAGVPSAAGQNDGTSTPAQAVECQGDAGGIVVPRGFCATVFADGLGHVRHILATPDGALYANTWTGPYYPDQPPPGGFVVALKDQTGDGKADIIQRFGASFEEGGRGGTGIGRYKDWIYVEHNDAVVRYALKPGEIAPTGEPETIVSGIPVDGEHPMHPFIIDDAGSLFIAVGSASNSCQEVSRALESPGRTPCKELDTRAGVWRYDANKTDQVFSPNERYATGLRNSEGFDFDAAGRLFVTMHGRDQLHENWPKLYDAAQGAELPSEEVVELKEGAEYGWPQCYFDPKQGKLVLAPEYGGDGGRKVGVCANRTPPIATYPAHWAPNDLKIYKAAAFPKPYRGGAFIAFHGSWNRAPGPQGGYNVVFQPLADGRPLGPYITFADGFAGASRNPGQAVHRPMGLAVGPDGALYVSDDVKGRIWRITYEGDPGSMILEAAPAVADAASSGPAGLAVPAGRTKEAVELGYRIFHGEVSDGTCGSCHGREGTGTPGGPDLTTGNWLWADGSLESITKVIVEGVAAPKRHLVGMPPLGGTSLTDAEVDALASYVWAISHSKGK